MDLDRMIPRDRYPFGRDGTRSARILALAEALASSPAWRQMTGAVLVVRTEPPEGIAFLGHFTDEEAAFVERLPGQLEATLPHFRYVSYPRAEADAELLARQLIDRYGVQGVRKLDYTAIPRGGFFVLGMLAYILGLSHDGLAGREREGRPLVIVDDCALSGVRFRGFLEEQAAESVVFAHLYSHPHLREAIRSSEPRVAAVLAAGDLSDHAPALQGEEYGAWQDRWRRRGGNEYWVGQPDHLGFPWAEPDVALWDPASETETAGWRVVPPSACLKNRHGSRSGIAGTGDDPGTDPAPRVQVQRGSSGRVQLAPRTYVGDLDEGMILANLDTLRVVRLEGVARDLWMAAQTHPTLDLAVEELAARYDAEPAGIREDLEGLLRSLEGAGLVQPSDPDGG
jgi:hypothetical protein